MGRKKKKICNLKYIKNTHILPYLNNFKSEYKYTTLINDYIKYDNILVYKYNDYKYHINYFNNFRKLYTKYLNDVNNSDLKKIYDKVINFISLNKKT